MSNLVSCNNLSVNNNLAINGNITSGSNIQTTANIQGGNLCATSNVSAKNITLTGQLNNLTLTNLNSLDTVTSIQTQLNNCAIGTNVVDLVTNQTVGGVKTFSSSPVVPTCTAMNNSTNVASTAYVDSAISALSSSAPSTLATLNELATALGDNPNFATTITNQLAGMGGLASNNSWSGTNSFGNTTTLTGNLVVNSQTLSPTVLSYLVGSSSNLQTQLNAKAVDSAVVHNTTNETIAGIKTFTSAPVLPSNSITDTMIDNSCISSGFCDATSSIQTQLTKITPDIYSITGGTNITLPIMGTGSYYCYQNTTATFTTTFPTPSYTLPQLFIFVNLGTYPQTIATGTTANIVYESINDISSLTWGQSTFSLPVDGIVNLIFDGTNYFVLWNSNLDDAIYESLQNQINTINGNIASVNSNITTVNGNITNLNSNIQNEITTINGNITNLNSNIQNELTTVNGNITTLNTNIQNQITSVNGNVSTLTSNIQTQLNTIGTSITNINTNIDTYGIVAYGYIYWDSATSQYNISNFNNINTNATYFGYNSTGGSTYGEFWINLNSTTNFKGIAIATIYGPENTSKGCTVTTACNVNAGDLLGKFDVFFQTVDGGSNPGVSNGLNFYFIVL